MIPPFKYYFYPFLNILKKKGCCRLFDLIGYIAKELNLSNDDLKELTKGGSITKHNSRVNYCAAYLKRMGFVSSDSPGAYRITDRGILILKEYGAELTLTDLRNLPEFVATQVNANNSDVVFVKAHTTKSGKIVNAYICNKNLLKEKNPNIVKEVAESYRKSIKKEETSNTGAGVAGGVVEARAVEGAAGDDVALGCGVLRAKCD